MITTTEIAPTAALAPFVRCYSLRRFDTKGMDLKKPWNASQEISLFFFFNDKPVQLTQPVTGKIIKRGEQAGIMGLATQYNGEMTFNGRYSFFEIIFKPNGFYSIFRIPYGEIINQIVDAENIFDARANEFFEQLSAEDNLEGMSALADTFLFTHLKSRKNFDYKNAITSVSNLIVKNAGLVNIDELAAKSNMSIRSFERHFITQVGIPAKLYCCISRFNNAITLKLKYPKKDWTDIALASGYFDQMHLIKDFKRFTGNTPSFFLKQTPLKNETFTNRVSE